MKDRICSCCGQGYNDNERHDYEKCVRDCEARVAHCQYLMNRAVESLVKATCLWQSQREGKIK